MAGRAWQEDGGLSARYWSEATKERNDPPGVFYYWNGERPRHPNNAPQVEGTGEIQLISFEAKRSDGRGAWWNAACVMHVRDGMLSEIWLNIDDPYAVDELLA